MRRTISESTGSAHQVSEPTRLCQKASTCGASRRPSRSSIAARPTTNASGPRFAASRVSRSVTGADDSGRRVDREAAQRANSAAATSTAESPAIASHPTRRNWSCRTSVTSIRPQNAPAIRPTRPRPRRLRCQDDGAANRSETSDAASRTAEEPMHNVAALPGRKKKRAFRNPQVATPTPTRAAAAPNVARNPPAHSRTPRHASDRSPNPCGDRNRECSRRPTDRGRLQHAAFACRKEGPDRRASPHPAIRRSAAAARSTTRRRSLRRTPCCGSETTAGGRPRRALGSRRG